VCNAGPGFNAKGKKTLAHPEYHLIQAWWHPDLNRGKQPADFTHGSEQRVWLRCPGCAHGCGRDHKWEAIAYNLARSSNVVCPFCESKGGSFCECQSVAADPSLSREWHPNNPPPTEVAKGSSGKYAWVCLEGKGHVVYQTSCNQRCTGNTGCPACYKERRGTVRHPTLPEGRPDLAAEWDQSKNDKSPAELTLGSSYIAQWICARGHSPWRARVKDRALKGTGCPACGQLSRFRERKFGPEKF